jgi:hypothetical protein
MARSNGPFGPPGAPLRRRPIDEPYGGQQTGQPPSQWPSQGYPDHGHSQQAGQGYHFPPPEPEPNYGYNQQPLPPQQQWGQQADPRAYDLSSYLPPGGQPYAQAGPGPFAQPVHHQQQGYVETDAEYSDEFFEDEEPRRGRRWIFIVAALVGAIGVGGALAYTYRSLIAPGSGRVPLVKADPKVKVRPENPGGKEFAGVDKKLPNRLGEGTAPRAAPPPEPEQEAAPENQGPRPVKTIPIGAQPPPATIPGIALQNLPPPRPETTAKAPPPEPSSRVTIGEKPPAQAEDDDPPTAPPSPPVRKVTAATPPPVIAKAPPPKREAAPPSAPSSGLGFVAVVASQKTPMDALKAFADVAEKYAGVLSGRPVEVQEANLGEKGIWHRAVVGPPGSREAAISVCNQLKAAGHPDCWVKPY